MLVEECEVHNLCSFSDYFFKWNYMDGLARYEWTWHTYSAYIYQNTVKDDLFRIFQERAVLKLWLVTGKNLQTQVRIWKYPASKSTPALKPLLKATPPKAHHHDSEDDSSVPGSGGRGRDATGPGADILGKHDIFWVDDLQAQRIAHEQVSKVKKYWCFVSW